MPGFGGDFNRERALYDKWRAQRALAVQSLARTLAAALPPGPALLLVPPANASFGSVYGSWDDRRRPPPCPITPSRSTRPRTSLLRRGAKRPPAPCSCLQRTASRMLSWTPPGGFAYLKNLPSLESRKNSIVDA